MKNQTLYRGGENRKVKITKSEKVFQAVQAAQRKALALKPKKDTTV